MKNKMWMHVTVGTILISMLVIGIILIVWTVNSDLLIPDLDNDLAARGLEVAQSNGCVACHSLDGGPGLGPTWVGMYGSRRLLEDGSTVLVDEDYIIESISRPDAKVVEGFEKLMVRYFLPPEDLDALVEFTRQLAQ
jgi:mono/diheme cytochrome c family protein